MILTDTQIPNVLKMKRTTTAQKRLKQNRRAASTTGILHCNSFIPTFTYYNNCTVDLMILFYERIQLGIYVLHGYMGLYF